MPSKGAGTELGNRFFFFFFYPQLRTLTFRERKREGGREREISIQKRNTDMREKR